MKTTDTIALRVCLPFSWWRTRDAETQMTLIKPEKNGVPAYAAALCREIESLGRDMQEYRVDTLWFDGGYMGLFMPEQLEAILAAAHRSFHLTEDVQISGTVFPGSLDLAMISCYRNHRIGPLMFEMPTILNVWLTKEPDYCALFCNAILLSFICDQLTAGLNTINQAIGKIRTYTLLMYTPKLAYLPISYILFQNGGTIAEAMGVFVAIELLVALARIPYIHWKTQMSMKDFFLHVIVPLLPLALLACATSGGCQLLFHFKYRFLLTGVLSVSVSFLVSWFTVLDRNERGYFKEQILKRIIGKCAV